MTLEWLVSEFGAGYCEFMNVCIYIYCTSTCWHPCTNNGLNILMDHTSDRLKLTYFVDWIESLDKNM